MGTKGKEDFFEGNVSVIEVKDQKINLQNTRFQDRVQDWDKLCHAVDMSEITCRNEEETEEKEDVLEGNDTAIEVKVESTRARKRSVLQDWKQISQGINVR